MADLDTWWVRGEMPIAFQMVNVTLQIEKLQMAKCRLNEWRNAGETSRLRIFLQTSSPGASARWTASPVTPTHAHGNTKAKIMAYYDPNAQGYQAQVGYQAPAPVYQQTTYSVPQQQVVYETTTTTTQPQQPVYIVQTTVHDRPVNHCCHCVLCFFTAGLWLPCWIGACANCCCQHPCGA